MINQVLHGDCLELMKQLPDRSVDMILCDLPYGTTACKWDVIIPFEPLWEQYKRIVKPNAAIVLTGSQPFTSQLVMSNPKWFKYEWIWEKTMPSGFINAKNMPMKSHENILIFSNGTTANRSQNKMRYFPEMQKGHSPYKKIHRNDPRQGYMDTGGGRTSYAGLVSQSDGDRYPVSIVRYSNGNHNSFHPTQKPVALFEYLIKTYTNEGDLILDNCAGSGTTAIAALNTGRNYILMEKEAEYIEVINKRIANHTVQLSLPLAV